MVKRQLECCKKFESAFLCCMLLKGVTLLLGLAYAGILLYYRYGWFLAIRENWLVNDMIKTKPVFVSVLVPARNEAENIDALLLSLLSQDYPADYFEIIVLDDASTDNTADMVAKYAVRDARVRLIQLPADTGAAAHKKRAIEKGVAAANGTLIVCTDADCTHPKKWITMLAYAYRAGQNKFIAAPVVYRTRPNLLSVFETLDFMTLQGITAASVSTGLHTMCNGANIAYEKKAFEEVGGFRGIDHLPTGDDMLLMYKIYQRYPAGIAYLLHPQAVVHTAAAGSWRLFLHQRIRWASKAAFYDDRRVFRILLLVYLFNAWMLVLAVGAIWYSKLGIMFLACILAKTVFELFFLLPVSHFFKKQVWMVWFPLLQPIHIIYTLLAGWLGRFGSYEWKGRIIKNKNS